MKNNRTEKIQNFISKLSVIQYKYKLLEGQKEIFNIFSALHKENDEVRLHSRFISVLLSPIGSHGKGSVFAKSFLNIVKVAGFDLENAQVLPNEYYKSEYKEIDILLINRTTRQAVIIENKIDAGDSNHEDRGQLEGYYNRIVNEDRIPPENIHVLYLTKDGHNPSSESLGAYKELANINGQNIDYEHEIADWLNECLKSCINEPFLRESINQYQIIIKKMTNSSDLEERLEIKELVASSIENMKSAKLLVENFKHIKWHAMYDFWSELEICLIKEGCKMTQKPSENDITNTTHFESYKKSYESNNNYGLKFKINDEITAWIWNGEWLYWGISFSEISSAYRKEIDALKLKGEIQFEKNDEYYWKHFELENFENIAPTDFTHEGTFNLIDDSYRKTIINEKLVP